MFNYSEVWVEYKCFYCLCVWDVVKRLPVNEWCRPFVLEITAILPVGMTEILVSNCG